MPRSPEELKALPVAEVIREVGVSRATQIKGPAALLFTYRCSISCAHCLFACNPQVASGRMTVEDALEFLRQVHRLDRAVHIAGGEVFLFWSELAEVVEKAGKLGLAPHFIESNAFWAVNDAIVRERLMKLRDWGVLGMYFSADHYHQAYVPPGNFLRARAIAREIFDQRNVMATQAPPEHIHWLPILARDEKRFAEKVRVAPPTMLGSAAIQLAHLVPAHPVDSLPRCGWDKSAGQDCFAAFDPELMCEVHIDLYGNIQTNCGVILGNAKKVSVPDLFARGVAKGNPIVEILARKGPVGLLAHAREKGCPDITHATQKCHLCFMVRTFLRPHYPNVLGPAEIYPVPFAELLDDRRARAANRGE
ncbi:MAG: hypothetical protein FJ279_15495 [Planctomycetes bacterium]|nr:hypothetical protein [Planctomycetota bacterium]